jgi:hypothetical protein
MALELFGECFQYFLSSFGSCHGIGSASAPAQANHRAHAFAGEDL